MENQEKTTTNEQERIELRSEKVRNLIGEIPPYLIRWGNLLLLIIVTLLGLAFCILYKNASL